MMKKWFCAVLAAVMFCALPVIAMAMEYFPVMDFIVHLAGVDMEPGDYLYTGAYAVSSSAPDDDTGYAYLYEEDGMLVLVLHNYDNQGRYTFTSAWMDGYGGAVLCTTQDMRLRLEGKNHLTACIDDDEYISGIEVYDEQNTGSMQLIVEGSGSVNVEQGVNADTLFMNSGTLNADYVSAYNLTVNGGSLNVDTQYETALFIMNNGQFNGGTVNLRAAVADEGIALYSNAKTLSINGGELTFIYNRAAIKSAYVPFTCNLALPEGVEIRAFPWEDFWEEQGEFVTVYDYYMDYTAIFDDPDLQTLHKARIIRLPAQTADPVDPAVPAAPAVPTLPTTGDNAMIALWAALAMASAAAMICISRRGARVNPPRWREGS